MIERNRGKKWLIMVLSLGIAILYTEYLVYDIKAMGWPTKYCTNCVKVLLVADPQIVGEVNENYFGSWLARWDSDRYTAKTFSRALGHAQPDVIVFLGDLMDEGHIATNKEFIKYKQRLDNIFYTPEHIMKIYLPGDNDIGGEEDIVSSQIHERFRFAYSQNDTLTFKNLNFHKVNKLIYYIPGASKNAFSHNYTKRNTINIVMSHLPFFSVPDAFVRNVIDKLSPNVIFTAHDHRARHMSFDMKLNKISHIQILPPHYSQLYRLRLDTDEIHELQIPSCSYRMGTRFMGYGLVYIDTQDKSMEFTVLWLPERFTKLAGYLIFLLGILFMGIYRCNCGATSAHVRYNRLFCV